VHWVSATAKELPIDVAASASRLSECRNEEQNEEVFVWLPTIKNDTNILTIADKPLAADDSTNRLLFSDLTLPQMSPSLLLQSNKCLLQP
jgi:hypothetical protein